MGPTSLSRGVACASLAQAQPRITNVTNAASYAPAGLPGSGIAQGSIFVVFGSNLKLLHWSYKRYLEKQIRQQFDLIGTPVMFSFRQEDKERKSKK